MSEYIITIPDSCFPSSDTYRDIYYPDERHNQMPLEEIVRCRDCKWLECYEDEPRYVCRSFDRIFERSDIMPDGFCAWAKRKGGGE